jgi:hypothetical protein
VIDGDALAELLESPEKSSVGTLLSVGLFRSTRVILPKLCHLASSVISACDVGGPG